MKVKVISQYPQYSCTNDGFLGFRKEELVVSIDDGGKELGELIVGILAMSGKVLSVDIVPSYITA